MCGVWLSGKVLGVYQNDSYLPFYSDEGVSFSMPYLLPFVDNALMEKWTSIPSEFHQTLSSFCLNKAVEYFSLMEKANGRPITVGDLARTTPQVSAPFSLIYPRFIGASEDVVEVLKEARGRVDKIASVD